jgi:hypothetical protein
MMELKVQCDCGQKYKFDVEPVNGRMPFTVTCPICGADGTTKANAILRDTVVHQIPAPPSLAPPPPPPPPVPVQPTLRVGGSAGMPAHSAPPPISPLSTAPAPISRPVLRPVTSFAAQAAAGTQSQPGRKPSFALGLLGGFLGALVGATIYYLIFKVTGYRIGLLAIGVGALAGWSADFLGKGEGSKELGGITAILVLVGVVGAQYFVALGWWHDIIHGIEDAGYTASVAEAREAVKAIPTGSDAEIRLYLVKQEAGDSDERPAVNTITDREVKEFREKQLPDYQDLASGKETRGQYLAKNGVDSNQVKKIQDTEENTFKDVFLLLLVSKMGIISLIAGAGLAYKLSTNA